MVSFRWSTFGRNAEAIPLEEPTADNAKKNVVNIPFSYDALAKEIRETSNAIVKNETEHEQLGRKLAGQMRRMAEQIRSLGIKADLVPEIAALLDKGAGE